MDWTTIISLVIGLITGGGLSTIITLRLIHRQKKHEVERLAIDIRKLQDGEHRERVAGLIKDLSDANDIIRDISAKLQVYIANEVQKDLKIAQLEARNKMLEEMSCKKYCCCIDFDKDINTN